MPYHVIVTRQVLLDGPMALRHAGAVLLVRYASTGAPCGWSPRRRDGAGRPDQGDRHRPGRRRLRVLRAHPVGEGAVRRIVAWSLAAWRGRVLAFPLALRAPGARTAAAATWPGSCSAGRTTPSTSTSRRFRPRSAWLVARLRCRGLWSAAPRELLARAAAVTWIVVPVVFFTLWPVKGYQYLLPVAPVAPSWPPAAWRPRPAAGCCGASAGRRGTLQAGVLVAVTISLLVPTWQQRPAVQHRHLPGRHPAACPAAARPAAGSGEHPGGRDAAHGRAVDGQRHPVLRSPAGVRAVGQPQPAQPQPVLRAGRNPDLPLRNGRIQYLVWDSYSAGRSPCSPGKMLA